MSRLIKTEIRSIAMLLECHYITQFWEECIRKIEDEEIKNIIRIESVER